MRRQYLHQHAPLNNQFVNNYHVNEVPLPYYNPLADPHLSVFFSNSKINRHVHRMGLQYSPVKDYPYQERRLINSNKFHKDNYYDVRPSNLYKNNSSFLRKDKARSILDSSKGVDQTQAQMFKKTSELDLKFRPNQKIVFKPDLLSQRPTTPSSSRKAVFSSQGKNRSNIFRRRDVSNSRDHGHQDGLLKL